jgi:hypothetical protein
MPDGFPADLEFIETLGNPFASRTPEMDRGLKASKMAGDAPRLCVGFFDPSPYYCF